MAKKTNKTDHVLNLLSSGKKASKEENDAPPVDLRRKAPTPPETELSAGRLTEEELPEPEMTQQEDESLPEPRMSDRPGEEPLPEPRMSDRFPEESLSEAKISIRSEGKAPAVVEVAAAAPSVSVVHASDGEDPIAEAVKESLEAEFDDFLKERNEPSAINVFELLGADAEAEAEIMEEEPEAQIEEAARVTAVPEPQEPEPTMEPKPEMEPEPEEAPETENTKPATPGEKDIEKPEEDTEPAEERMNEHETKAAAEPETIVEKTAVEETMAAKPEEAQPQVDPEEPQHIADSEESPQKEAAQQKEKDMQQSKEEEKNYIMINVMERLVRDQVPAYIRQFGHCDCDRCIEDTVALTLTHLPSKYVVVNKNAVSPLLNFYEKKYAGQLIVEITKATMIVNESPHH